MKTEDKGTGPRRRPTMALITRALNDAVQDAVELHKRAGAPLAVWKDGKVALVPADSATSNGKRTKSRRRRS